MIGRVFKIACLTPYFDFEGLFWPLLPPKTYLDEEDDNVVVYFEIPGVRKEDIELYVSERGIRLRARVSNEVKRRLCKPSEYRKTVYLRTPIDPDRATSKYENGILKVILPKKKPGKRVQVE